LSSKLYQCVSTPTIAVPLPNVTARRSRLLAELAREAPAREVLALATRHAGPTSLEEKTLALARQNELLLAESQELQKAQVYQSQKEYFSRAQNFSKLDGRTLNLEQKQAKDIAERNTLRNGESWLAGSGSSPPGAQVSVYLSPMIG